MTVPNVKRRTQRKRGRPPRGDSPDSRRRLLEAAASVLSERGYRNATVDQIVAEAGLSKGSFYWNFAAKEELFLSLLDERIDRPARELMDITRAAPADAATAPGVSRGLADLLLRQRELVLLLHEYWSAAVRDERVRERYVKRQTALREGLATALATRHETTGVPLSLPAQDLATAFIALAEGLAMDALVAPDSVPEGLYGEILSLVYEGLVARAGRPATPE